MLVKVVTRHNMKAYGRVKLQLHSLLTSVLDGGKWSTSRPERFTLGERAPRYPLDRRLEVPHNRSGQSGGKKEH